MENNIKAVVFDIDGTLSPDISWTKLTLMLGASVPDHLAIYESFKHGQMEYEESKTALLKLWRGDGDVSKKKLENIFNEWDIKPDAKEVFDYLRAKGIRTCLVTGSVDLFAEVIAQRVGADEWYANTVLHWDEDNNLKDYDYERNAGDKKLAQLMEFCEKNSIDVSECIAVGDDANDVELFKATGRGIAVESSTSHLLDSVAWKKVKDLGEIKQIL